MKIIVGVKKGKVLSLLNKKIKKHLCDAKGNALCGVSPIEILTDSSWARHWDDKTMCKKCKKIYHETN